MVDFTGGTWRSLIDGSEVGVIPDSGLLRDYNYLAQTGVSDNETISTLVDSQNNVDLSGFATFREGPLNGNDAGDYNGIDDAHSGDVVLDSGQFTVAVVVRPQEIPNDGSRHGIMLNGSAANNRGYSLVTQNAEWQIVLHGNVAISGGTVTQDGTIFIGRYDGSELSIRVNGATVATTSTNYDPPDSGDIDVIGDNEQGALDMLFGRCLQYDTYINGDDLDALESALSSEWGVSFS